MSEETKKLEDKSYEELLKQVKHEKQRLFLEEYPKFRISSQTCEAIGIGESTPRSWYKDEVFNSAFIALKKEVSRKLIEEHEKNIDTVAFGEKTPAQSRIFGSLVRLRAEAPDKYREKVVATPLIGNVTIKMDIPRPWKLPQADIIDVEAKEIAIEQG